MHSCFVLRGVEFKHFDFIQMSVTISSLVTRDVSAKNNLSPVTGLLSDCDFGSRAKTGN